jgi:16S rRNA (guanine527-N7)-methyltransferase
MSNDDILLQGINTLRKSDSGIDSLFSNRETEIISLLRRYIKEIETFNPAYGLVGTENPEDLVIKHILDSLAPLGIISRLFAKGEARIADAGSGAGLPGIPLAIALPKCGFTLIERMGRRAGFLLNTTAVLGLGNVTVEEKELEQTAQGQFDLVTFRAFKPLEPRLLKTLFSVCAENGVIAAYKGKKEKIEHEMQPLEKLCAKWEAVPYNVPLLDEERHLLVIRVSSCA